MGKIYDVAVVGCGIAGASVVYQAYLKGLSSVVFEGGDFTQNASSAAGAFLSPKFGPDSAYNDFINRAFLYSLDFYQNHFGEFLKKCGMLRLARSENERKKCDSYVKNSPFWIKKDNGYWCEKAALISSTQTIKKMISRAADCQNREVGDFFYENEHWNIGDIKAKHLVISTGAKMLLNEPYLRVKAIFGQKIGVKSQNGFDYSIHRKCSISPKNDENIVYVGASHIPSWRYKNSEELFEQHKKSLIDEGENILGNRVEIVSESRGFRASTIDFFPYCGEAINAEKTLLKMPNVISGSKFHNRDFVYYKNLWIHQGHGARGFVLSPYTALQIIKKITNQTSEEERHIGLKRAFLSYVRKHKNLSQTNGENV